MDETITCKFPQEKYQAGLEPRALVLRGDRVNNCTTIIAKTQTFGNDNFSKQVVLGTTDKVLILDPK